MAVEETQISSPPTAEETANLKTQDDVNDDEAEEGEILDDEESSSKKSSAVAYQPHPLEHQWTFWFINPSAKSRQATWGSYMRPVYTFATVEEFWRSNVFVSVSTKYSSLEP